MMWEAKQLIIQKQELALPDWPEGFDGVRFLFITDLHRRLIPKHVRQALLEEKLDLVLIGGDITEKRVSLKRVEDNIRFLSSLGPSYFVWGNHDYAGDYRALDTMLRDYRVTILDNKATSFESGSDRLWLVGIDECSLKRDQLNHALMDIEEPGYRLLLSHNPIIIEKLKEQDQIKGVLSGHTHGGQICLPLLGPISLPPNSFYRKYVSGEFLLKNGSLKLFVSKGAGTSNVPLRLLAPPEVHIFTMKALQKN
jgi:predicted MPP superfamily phosphohydrolase